jgi:hypothetical protein
MNRGIARLLRRLGSAHREKFRSAHEYDERAGGEFDTARQNIFARAVIS